MSIGCRNDREHRLADGARPRAQVHAPAPGAELEGANLQAFFRKVLQLIKWVCGGIFTEEGRGLLLVLSGDESAPVQVPAPFHTPAPEPAPALFNPFNDDSPPTQATSASSRELAFAGTSTPHSRSHNAMGGFHSVRLMDRREKQPRRRTRTPTVSGERLSCI